MFLRANSIFTHFAIISLFCTSIFFHSDISGLLQANSIAMLKHDPIKNMVYPYSKTVDWSKSLSSTSLSLSQIDSSLIIEPIKYIPSQLGPIDNLDSLDSQTLNARLTYSVPYLGNYKYDGKEYVGSHPGVDIKLPKGTPILSIANGIVTKAKHSDIGFGNHVVIRHNNVYNPELNAYEDIFSSYAHLSQINVQAGDVVKVGQIIGSSGSTGLSTGAHLNFQIEKDSAPYHPYWPFSDREIYAAGLNFVSGVNKAYGFENALEHTYNPLVYIDSAFIDTFVAVDKIEESNAKTELPEDKNVFSFKTEPVIEYLSAAINIEKKQTVDHIEPEPLVESSFEVASVEFDSQSSYLWNLPPLIQPAKTYEFMINRGIYNLEDLRFESNKSVQINFVEQVENELLFTLETNSIGSVQLNLLSGETLIESKILDSLMLPVKNVSDVDYEKIKLLSIMGFMKLEDVNLDSNISIYHAVKQLSQYFKYKGFNTLQLNPELSLDPESVYDGLVLASSFNYGLLNESDIIELDNEIDFGVFFAKYYKSINQYVSPLPKLPFKRHIRMFGANKLYVQQAIIDGLITTEQLTKHSLNYRDLINITYNLIVKK